MRVSPNSSMMAAKTSRGGMTRIQVAALHPRRHGLQPRGRRTTRDGVPANGAFSTGSVGPRICTTGVPTRDAT